MQQAVAEGRTVGPTFLKLTDVFVSAVDTKTIPPGGRPPPQCEWVFSLHNAVSNRILFAPEEDKQSGQTTLDALKMWINCIRLCEWEIYKLNNIFTGTLVGLRDPQAQRSPLVKGRLEDWVQVRIPGDAEWRKAYLVVSDGTAPAKSKRRLSSFMSLSSSQSHNLNEHGQSGPSACFYANKRSKKPFLTYTRVNVAQAVFPEAEQLISSTAVAKVEGTFEWDKSDFPETPEGLQVNEKISLAKLASGKGEDHAATMIMPDPDSAPQDRQGAMLAWVLAFADVFGVRCASASDFIEQVLMSENNNSCLAANRLTTRRPGTQECPSRHTLHTPLDQADHDCTLTSLWLPIWSHGAHRRQRSTRRLTTCSPTV